MQRKRILFIARSLICGGLERSLISVLKLLSTMNCDVTLLLIEKKGSLLQDVPQSINVTQFSLPNIAELEFWHGTASAFVKAARHWNVGYCLEMVLREIGRVLLARKLPRWFVMRAKVFKQHSAIGKEQFDFVFAYADDCECYSIAHAFFKKSHLGAWVHSVYSHETYLSKPILDSFKYRFATSNESAKNLNATFGATQYFKCLPICIPFDELMMLSNSGKTYDDDFDGLRILTIARLDQEKGVDLCPMILKTLLNRGHHIRWYIVGAGNMEEKLRQQVLELGIEPSFVLLGLNTNPYAFLRDCDIYVQPSRHETYCISLAEARCFCKPIVVTDFCGAAEQIKDNNTGMIVKSLDVDALANSVERLLLNPIMRNQFTSNLRQENVDNLTTTKTVWQHLIEEGQTI